VNYFECTGTTGTFAYFTVSDFSWGDTFADRFNNLNIMSQGIKKIRCKWNK